MFHLQIFKTINSKKYKLEVGLFKRKKAETDIRNVEIVITENPVI